MNLKAYRALIRNDLKLALRNRATIVLSYLLPLVFFLIFGFSMHAERGGMAAYVVAQVMVIGILSSGLMGGGIRAVQEREQNILRRFRVAPISPLPILVASAVTGLILYLPSVPLFLLLANNLYGMPMPEHTLSLLIFAALGLVAMRALGLIIASSVNTAQEAQLLTQFFYFPLMFLSGATIPLAMMGDWAKLASQFMPSAYLVTGFQGVLIQNDSLARHLPAAAALALTSALGLFIAVKLFRWEKDEKVKPQAKLWVLGVLAPFFVLGGWQVHTKDQLKKADILWRELARNESILIRGARIFVGDGEVIESGSVLVKGGKIAEIYRGEAPDPKTLGAELVDGSGKTLLPGLIDVHTHLGAPAGVLPKDLDSKGTAELQKLPQRHLTAYLYSGVTAVRSVGDDLETSLKLREQIRSGEKLGAELFACGPMFTTKGGHGTEYFRDLPGPIRASIEAGFVRTPQTPDEARTEVDELAQAHVDAIKAVVESGTAGNLFNRIDPQELAAVIDEGHKRSLPVTVHTGDSQDVRLALDSHADGIEHGSFRDAIPAALFDQMIGAKTTYDPTLAVVEAFGALAKGDAQSLGEPLVQQTVTRGLLDATRDALASKSFADRTNGRDFQALLAQGKANLVAAWKAGVPLAMGTDAGNTLVFHGPSMHRELQLWVEAGIPAEVALQAATSGGAKALRADGRIGYLRKGYEANLLLVEGNPLKDISATQHISLVVFKGERLSRSELFEDSK